MTPERRKAFIIMVTTFLIGILVGILATSLWSKYAGNDGGRERFIQKILSVVEADSGQEHLMRPLLTQTMTRIDSLRQATGREVHTLVDSLEIKLQPILNPEQLQKLNQFHQRGRELRKK